MPCYHPVDCWQLESGEIVFNENRGSLGKKNKKRVDRARILRSLTIPCGQCIGCRLERSRQWAMRCIHESSLYSRNSFVTLTFDDEHCPNSLDYSLFQLFMKRARKKFGPFRFYMCGEYGERTLRPHFHALFFGLDFSDRYLWRMTDAGSRSYRSPELESVWTLGHSEVGDVTFESAAYVARYVVKKVTGSRADEHYRRVDSSTGEIVQVEPEFTRMSLKPGIGAGFVEKWKEDIYPHDYVVVNGRKCKPPRYYDQYLAGLAGTESDELEFDRQKKAAKFRADSTPERLEVREKVARSRLKFKQRSML